MVTVLSNFLLSLTCNFFLQSPRSFVLPTALIPTPLKYCCSRWQSLWAYVSPTRTSLKLSLTCHRCLHAHGRPLLSTKLFTSVKITLVLQPRIHTTDSAVPNKPPAKSWPVRKRGSRSGISSTVIANEMSVVIIFDKIELTKHRFKKLNKMKRQREWRP